MKINTFDDGFEIVLEGRTLFKHTTKQPLMSIGKGDATYDMYRGNFDIKDRLFKKIPLTYYQIDGETVTLSHDPMFKESVVWRFEQNNGQYVIHYASNYKDANRYWFNLVSSSQEALYGCGEQMSYFNLKGRHFPLWTSEPGVGRDKTSPVTFQADVKDKAGGDYYNTNYPEPTFVSSQKYVLHLACQSYMDFDFSLDDEIILETWSLPSHMLLIFGTSYLDLFPKIKEAFGTQPLLPDWIYEGVSLGLQGGTERVLELTKRSLDHGIKVNAIWAQDWQGKKITSFGKRLFWDWQWSPAMYPELDTKIWELKKQGIRFMGYINPYLNNQGPLYKEALKKGYFATAMDGSEYLVDFGEFDCGVIDFTNPEANEWYKQLIKRNLIDFGLDGWMADFGEYLPTDLKLFNNQSAKLMHNEWPTLWAKCNYEAIKEAGRLGDIVFFMRAGFSGVQAYCPLLWAGDQCCDFSAHDGLRTVITAALSSGMIGNGLNHSDIGGYTSLHGVIRTEEVFVRWTEMAAFTPYMRTHEGNRPDENFQYYNSASCMKHLALFSTIYKTLSPYTKHLVQQNHELGIPVQRALFVHDDHEAVKSIQDTYMFGEDMVVAPIIEQGQTSRMVYLPKGEWIHLMDGTSYAGRTTHHVEAPIGKPAVFYRKGSDFTTLFESIQTLV